MISRSIVLSLPSVSECDDFAFDSLNCLLSYLFSIGRQRTVVHKRVRWWTYGEEMLMGFHELFAYGIRFDLYRMFVHTRARLHPF